MKDHYSTKQTGFSLVELSIVLVILGLLVGGILGGQSLIRAAELRSITSDLSRFQAAMYTFREKYLAVPGDMKNATSFWGNAATGTTGGECTDNLNDTGTGTQTCNGDGDGWIYNTTTSASYYERYRAWQHLGNAGLIEGSYTGAPGPGGAADHVAGKNSPASKVDGATFAMVSTSAGSTGAASVYDVGAYIAIEFRIQSATGYASLPPTDQWNLDKKLDDGRPGSGIMASYKPALQPNCATTAVNATAEYKFATTARACSIIYLVQGAFK